jgi:hypothetical protein
MRKLLVLGILSFGIAAYAGEKEIAQGARLLVEAQYRLFENYRNIEANF